VVVVELVAERARRERLQSALGYLGYACLDRSTWISPRPSVELESLLEAERISAERFRASYQGDARGLAARAWDLDRLAAAYCDWLGRARELVRPTERVVPDETVFAIRSALVHEWRKFLFSDPGLPAELLPARWPGRDAADLFHDEADRLLPAAARFVDGCLTGSTGQGGRTDVG
jgi:phenylacetic acid degradation operon negative regulatory protein